MRKWWRKKQTLAEQIAADLRDNCNTAIYGDLVDKMNRLRPGQVVRMTVKTGPDFVMLYAEDFDFILEKAKMRVSEQGPDGKAPALPPSGG